MKNTLSFLLFWLITHGLYAQETLVFEWATGLGIGLNGDYANAITTDADGNVITTGRFYNTVDFDPGPGVFNLIGTGLDNKDGFVLKQDPAGNLLWAKAFVGDVEGSIGAVTTDADGNIYVTGLFKNTTDFDPGPGVFELTGGGTFTNNFICKLDEDGNFIWAVNTPGGFGQQVNDIYVDAAENVHILGHFVGTVDFDPGAATNELTAFGQWDVMVLKLDVAGNFVWVKRLGGTDYDFGHRLSTDASGNFYVSGVFQGTADFDPGAGVANVTSSGLRDLFVCKLTVNGDFIWSKKIGGAEDILGLYIETDAAGNVYGTGNFETSTIDFDPGAGVFNLTGGNNDVFVLKLDSDGDFVWAKSMGGSESYFLAPSIGVDATGVYLTGSMQGRADFDPGSGVFNLAAPPSGEIGYVSKLDTDGDFVWAVSMASNTVQYRRMEIDDSSNIFITGRFNAPLDFDPDPCNEELLTSGVFFIQKLSLASQPPPPCGPQESSLVIYNAVSPDGNGSNEIFLIENIDAQEETRINKVTIYNRWGDVVFDVSDYDNLERVFKGVSNSGKNLPSGTYYYKIEFTSGLKTERGYLRLIW